MPAERQNQRMTEMEKLRQQNAQLVAYVRRKVDQLLEVMGTSHINPDELDDQMLLDLDPIGIVCHSFSHVLANLRETNDELRFARDEIRTVFDTAGTAIMVLNPRQEIVAFNHKVDEFFLAGERSVVGRTCREVICGDAYRHDCCGFESIINDKKDEIHLEWVMGERCFDVTAKAIKDDQGGITHVVLSYNDITERKRSMLTLRDALMQAQESRNRINSILLSVEDALIVTDAAGLVVMANETGNELLNGVLELPRASADDGLAVQLYAHLQSGQEPQGIWVGDLTLAPLYREPRVFQARTSRVPQQGKEGGGCVTLLHEVTREREIERLKSEFVSTAAHELRTPLSTILGFSELILNEENLPIDDLREYVGIVHQKAEGLSLIVNDLLDISRIESGEGLNLEVEECSLKELCNSALLGFSIYKDRYAFKLNLPAQDVRVNADRYAISQVLENVIGNAIKYSPAGSLITLEADVIGGECHVCVCDEGIGMSNEQAQRIFDKFYRADASNTAVPGTGLGMTIVKYIIEAHGGKVWVSSIPGEGTTVHFTLLLPA